MQVEMGESIQPSTATSSTDCSESPLVTKLLSLWAHGILSAVLIRELAHLAMVDGANHNEVLFLARCGNFGNTPGNIHRDVLAKFAKGCQFVSTAVSVPCIDPKTNQPDNVDAEIFVPHLTFATLAKGFSSKFDDLFSTKKLHSFWTGVEETQDDRLHNHPMCSK